MPSEVSKRFGMSRVLSPSSGWGRSPALLAILTALAAGAAATTVGCNSRQTETGPGPTAMAASPTAGELPEPQILSLGHSDSPTADVHDLIMSWEPVSGIDRFALCETVPPRGTDCEDHIGVLETSVTVPGPTADPRATGTWLKYLWLQSCGERECSRPPTPAGAITHRVAFGTNAWNFIVVVRRLERSQIEISMANASERTAGEESTLVARTPAGSELARCVEVAPGEWCGPFESTLLSNDIVAEQIYGEAGASVEFQVMPSTTAPGHSLQPTP